MLPRARRLRRSAEFAAVLSRGRRSRTDHLSLHWLAAGRGEDQPSRAGFVVSGKVGNSVVRHRVTRRLREQVRPLLAELPNGTELVIRAFPPAARASSAELRDSLRSAFRKAGAR